MATRLEDVYRHFLHSIEDEEWSMIKDESIIIDMMLSYLEKATVDFKNICRKSLKIDYSNNCFYEELDLNEIIILSKAMILHYLEPKILREQNLENAVTSKDFTAFSNSTQLREMVKLKDYTRKELKSYLTEYDYENFEGLN